MAMELRGGNINSLVEKLNGPYIQSTVVTKHNNNITIDVNINCTECCQHQGGTCGGDVHKMIESIRKMAASSGYPTKQIESGLGIQPREAAVKSQFEPAQRKAGKKNKAKVARVDHQCQTSSPTAKPAIREGVTILDQTGTALEPGDAVEIDCVDYLYVGDGFTVWCDEDSKTVVKEKLNVTSPFRKLKPTITGNLKVYSPEERVQRALQQVGRECPVPGGHDEDFVYWTYTGLGCKQSFEKRFKLLPY